MPRTHQNALCDPQIAEDEKMQVQHNMFWCDFVDPHQAHTSMKNGTSMFHALITPKHTT
jgi:hypothetical protein